MSSVGIIVKPPTKRGGEEAKRLLRRCEYEALFINLPRNMDTLLTDYMLEGDEEVFIQRLRKLEELPEPRGAHIIGMESLIRDLPEIAGDRPVFCYGSPTGLRESTDLATKAALLTLHDSLTSSISIEKWRGILEEEAERSAKWIEEEADYIASEAEPYRSILCVSGFEGRFIKQTLEASRSWIRYTGTPYHFTPLEVLRRISMLREPSDEEIEILVKQHIEYVRSLVIPRGLEEGAEEWSKRRLYWLRHLMGPVKSEEDRE